MEEFILEPIPHTAGIGLFMPNPAIQPTPGNGILAGSFPDGITSIEGQPTPATVRVLWRTEGMGDGTVVATTQSRPDGTWMVEGLNPNLKFDVVGRKDGFNDVIMADVSPYSADVILLSGGFEVVKPDRNRIQGTVRVSGGVTPYTVSVIGDAPSGIEFAYVAGSINASGTTEEWGDFLFDLRVTAANGVWGDITIELLSVDGQFDKVVTLLHMDGDLSDEKGNIFTDRGSRAMQFVPGHFASAAYFSGIDGNQYAKGPKVVTMPGANLSGDLFTVEFFVLTAYGSTGTRVPVSSGSYGVGDGNVLGWWCRINETAVGFTQSTNGSGGSTNSIAGTLDNSAHVGVWTHMAIVRSAGGLTRIFLAGKKVAEGVLPASWYNTPSGITIGRLDYPSYSYPFMGGVDELRITKGIARYTEDFTPPTLPF